MQTQGYFVGLDVGLHKTAICVVDGEGRPVWSGDVASEAEVIAGALSRYASSPLKLGLETGQLSNIGDIGDTIVIVPPDAYKGESHLKRWGKRLAQKKGMKRAIVAVARRMAVILHRMLVTGQPYDDSRLKVA